LQNPKKPIIGKVKGIHSNIRTKGSFI